MELTFEQRKRSASNTVGGIVSSLLPNERIVLLCNIPSLHGVVIKISLFYGCVQVSEIKDTILDLHGIDEEALLQPKLVIVCLSGDDRYPSKTAVRASSAAILARILVMRSLKRR
ncbi:unnamed protein product [Arabis nemorensis]|uniref:Uncharacterized protein n=1 Tax=Arabis nemorensis TaxID=586526 RepID=A0A565CFG8_9BRAS|nr:unnamed protein product [Arabis nemorensis]